MPFRILIRMCLLLSSAFFLALYLIMVVRGLLNKSYFAKVRHKAPLYSVIILVIMLYDFLTVKTGILKQPFFPCVNTILCAIIDDRGTVIEKYIVLTAIIIHGIFYRSDPWTDHRCCLWIQQKD